MGIIVLNKESDGDIPDQTFGEIFYQDVTDGIVCFEIDMFGQFNGKDIHQFGFQSTYDGALTIDPSSIGRADLSVYQDGRIAGMGRIKFDWVVDFDAGTPALEPVSFNLIGDSSFSAENLTQAPMVDFRGEPISAGVHVQRTSTPAGSESFTGVVGDGTGGTVPEPSSALAFAAILVGCFLTKSRRKRKCAIA